MNKPILFTLFIVTFLSTVFGECWPQALAKETYSLSRILELADSFAANLDFDVAPERQLAEGRRQQVDGEFGPKIEAILGVGPAKGENGNALDSHSTGEWGPTYLSEVTFSYPVWTWGRKAKYLEAVEHGKRAGEWDVEKRRQEIRFKIKQAYWGALFAFTMEDFLQGVEHELIDYLRKLIEQDRPVYSLQIVLAEIQNKKWEAIKAKKVALHSLALATGRQEMTIEDLDTKWLAPHDRELKSFEYYLAKMESARPELGQITEGVEAHHDLAKAERLALLPTFGLLAKYTYAHAPESSDQSSRFAYDPQNREELMAGVGLKWNFDWDVQQGKAQQEVAAARVLESKQKFAKEGLSLELRQKWLEVDEWQQRWRASHEASKAAKKWLTELSLDLGVSSPKSAKEVEDAFKSRGLTLAKYYEALWNYHLAWGALSQAVGEEIDPFILTQKK